MGVVRKVYDHHLDRTLALKIMRADRLGDPRSRARFLEEARINARLQHPGVVAVHDRGELPDGRPWFTMRRVRGRTLDEVMDDHFAGKPDAPPFRRLIDALSRVARTVAYAHVHRVVHRDLKPANVMLGVFGEVLVLDWGIARLDGGAESDAPLPDDAPPRATIGGRIVGTPAYMSPEQARGDRAAMGPHSDVYALGAILYHMLAGRAPYGGSTALAHAALLKGPPTPIAECNPPAPVPEDLAAVCAAAMARYPNLRPTAEGFAAELENWLDGVRKRTRALEIVAEADAMLPQVEALRAETTALRARAAAILGPLPEHAPIADKRPGWALEDDATRKAGQAQILEVRMLQTLRSALNVVADLPEAHDRLAGHYRRQVDAAESARDFAQAAVYEELVRSHDRGALAEWLTGDGALTLVTDPPGARVRLFRFEEVDRRLIEVEVGALGHTPLVRLPLARGSHLLIIEAPGHDAVRYPVFLERGEHWDGIRPGSHEPHVITLPREGELAADDCYVPAGWSWLGGDSRAADSLSRRRVWIDGIVVKRYPVTNAEYMAFLTSRSAEQLRGLLPAEPAMGEWHPLYRRRADGGFDLPAPDPTGKFWQPDWAVTHVDWQCALSYAAWQTECSGMTWRLPHAFEREKAARGADGRSFPWGDHFDATRAHVLKSSAAPPGPLTIGSFADDMSVYGIRDLVGNVKEWCLNRFEDSERITDGRCLDAPSIQPGPSIEARGGGWHSSDYVARPAARFGPPPDGRYNMLGFRLAASWLPRR
ncbi:MAG: SUMF1/EgtB/PvdO family nonheme iron enzyme [Myxococcales bacterium]|nr:SUMF1/EgtB/PvdO family nonheme iron enzyme [Myxococcales bacterium]